MLPKSLFIVKRLTTTIGTTVTGLQSRHHHYHQKYLGPLNSTAQKMKPSNTERALTNHLKFRNAVTYLHAPHMLTSFLCHVSSLLECHISPSTTSPSTQHRWPISLTFDQHWLSIKPWLWLKLTFSNPGASNPIFRANSISMICFCNWNLVMAQNEVSHPIHKMLDRDNYYFCAQAIFSFLKGRKLWFCVTRHLLNSWRKTL